MRSFKYFFLNFLFFMLVNAALSFAQIEKELQQILYPEKGDSATAKAESLAVIPVKDTAEMVRVPAGNFLMGSEDFEFDERPAHKVFLDEYWIDKYPVTNARYARFLNAFLEKFPGDSGKIGSFFDEEISQVHRQDELFVVDSVFADHPMVGVTWFGANAYAEFYLKRLPTEAEWEKAARGTDGKLYPWGNEIDSSRANFWNSGDPFEEGTTPVGFYNGQNYQGFQTKDSQSPYGCYDMVGNVREWVADWYQWDYYAKGRKINPKGPESGDKKVARGGGYLFHADELRATLRYSLEPDRAASFIGFRCVRRTAPVK
ncbi:MAG: formylglycine-generating enzyme family protein [Calditrichaeota bacterium]|nr:formylglycine-generating enzyme family protein [Calditrichota bacterium]